ncbi:phosphotransferase [Spiractinospora alimapuensis]|uniref:phosphotransferase n=1 Tax=Spiractinospora alimapuensis TaxID=2820884 RepID=UPI001F1DFC4E|nr:phosphotransferase [Spiractinospora alimapuensis]
MNTIDDVLALAATHGLHLSVESATPNEAGLDYRVVMAVDTDGRRWVLRVPRRPDVSEGMAAEVRVLDLVGPALTTDGVAVPDWRIRTPELIAYPAPPETCPPSTEPPARRFRGPPWTATPRQAAPSTPAWPHKPATSGTPPASATPLYALATQTETDMTAAAVMLNPED